MEAGLPANTGAAGAMHRVAFFAGKPAPTGIADNLINSITVTEN
ncbi:diguanylate cyclase [Pseudomonas sp. Leaf58]|nr:diguanylate cyclase [Pseudomonas sp. Leaf58]